MIDQSAGTCLPIFDLTPFLDDSYVLSVEECSSLAECLRATGCIVIRDPRVSEGDNERFLDMMERYFGQPTETKLADARPELHYQVGVTPSGVEIPKSLVDTKIQDQISKMAAEHRATTPQGADLKWRYFWRVGPRPSRTKFAELNAAPVVPKAFPEWQGVMDSWGVKLVDAARATARVLAVGFGLPEDAFTTRMTNGPHLLAPTGSDLAKQGQLGSVFAGYHYDLNFLTLHGKSRFPGLFVWLRNGQRVPVRIPDGCLLVQAGKQLEWLTGGHVQAGMHEVVVTEATVNAMAKAQAAGRSTWRVSSTVFIHVASDTTLAPLAHFADVPGAAQAYPPTLAGDQVAQELMAIALRPAEKAPC